MLHHKRCRTKRVTVLAVILSLLFLSVFRVGIKVLRISADSNLVFQQSDSTYPSSFIIHGEATLLNQDRQPIRFPYRFPVTNWTVSTNHSSASVSSRFLVAVLSSANNVKRRQLVRSTWGSNNVLGRLYFLVSGPWTKELKQELDTNRDVFYVEQEENYQWGLTPKVMAFFHAMVVHHSVLPPFEAILKTDDDSYVQMGLLQDWWNATRPDYAGCCFHNMPIVRDSTGPLRRYYVSPKLYPKADNVYPTYASGAGYMISPRAAVCVSQHMAQEPYLPSEDTNTGRILHDFCPHISSCTTARHVSYNFQPENAPQWHLQHYVKESHMLALHDYITTGIVPPLEPNVVVSANTTLMNQAKESYPIMYLFHRRKLVPLNQSSSLVVGILSTSSSARQLIRQTWGQSQWCHYKLFFLISGAWSFSTKIEFETHRDVFYVPKQQQPQQDTAARVLLFLQAVIHHGKGPFSVLVVQESSYVRIAKVRNAVHPNVLTGDYVGLCRTQSSIVRDPSHPYHVSRSFFDNDTYIPDHADGFGYLLSYKATACLVKHRSHHPHLPMDAPTIGWFLRDFCNISCTNSDRFRLAYNPDDKTSLVQSPISEAQLQDLKHKP